MKKWLTVSLFFLASLQGHEFKVYKKDYTTGSEFQMESKGEMKGSAYKSYFRWFKPLRDTYDVYDEQGDWIATGIGRIFCLGFFRPWGAEFDVYDKKWDRIGVIDGQVVTTGPAKFSFYNAEGKHIGTGYMDRKDAGFTIYHPEKTSHILASLRRNFVEDQTDYWTVFTHDDSEIDSRIIKVFTAFAVDKQAFFKEDK